MKYIVVYTTMLCIPLMRTGPFL